MCGLFYGKWQTELMPYIEYVGPPGSGKTTIARQLLSSDIEMGFGRRSLGGDDHRKRVNILGLPPEFHAQLRLITGLIGDIFLALRFAYCMRAPWSLRLRRSFSMAYLLARSRALANSKITWVLDQGLQQHILTCLAHNWITHREALAWKNRCNSKPYAPSSTHLISVPISVLSHRMQSSPKHIGQLGSLSVLEYARRNVRAYEYLYENAL